MSTERLMSWDAQLQAVHRRLREALQLARESVDGLAAANSSAGNDPAANDPAGNDPAGNDPATHATAATANRQPDLARELALYCVGFCVALDGHHSSEDAALFPLIVAEHPDLADVVSRLKQDHAMLGTLLHQFRRAVESGATGEELHRHLDGIGAIMESHFGFEERRLLTPLRTLAAEGSSGTALFGPLG